MKPFTRTGRILLMDDEEDIRQTTDDVLKRLGYTVDFADDGLRAIDLYRGAREAGTPFDAVIMDLTIPGGMGGVTRHWRDCWQSTPKSGRFCRADI